MQYSLITIRYIMVCDPPRQARPLLIDHSSLVPHHFSLLTVQYLSIFSIQSCIFNMHRSLCSIMHYAVFTVHYEYDGIRYLALRRGEGEGSAAVPHSTSPLSTDYIHQHSPSIHYSHSVITMQYSLFTIQHDGM